VSRAARQAGRRPVLKGPKRPLAFEDIMAAGSISVADSPLLRYVLRRADDALILGHRLSEWCGHAPILEEDLALANMGLDLIGQARALYGYAGEVEGAGHSEDDFAYLRQERDYGNVLLVEQPNGDFARTMMRQLLYTAFVDPYWRALMASSDATLRAIAAKAEKESAYHLRHSAEWVIRLGDGTPESHRRAQQAVDALWPYTGELFELCPDEEALLEEGRIADPRAMRDAWSETIGAVLAEATLAAPNSAYMHKGGRRGRHSEHLGHILSELQYLQRAYPQASW
jgi:ring-1,2-phenylacetyl-CoA epoxidase subunit PaaC